jgi:hypothetical protein
VDGGTIATKQHRVLDLFADEAAWSGVFDRLEVWRSRDTAAGPYESLTDDAWMPATLPAGANTNASGDPGPSANIDGLTLSLKVNELVDLEIVFDGSNPLTFALAATQITSQSLGLVRSFVSVTGALVLQSTAAGLQAILHVVGGSAAPLLGLSTVEPESVAFGRDARVPLTRGVTRYAFTDPNSSNSYFYKTRFFNSGSRAVSDFSFPFQAPPVARLSPDALVRGTVDLVDVGGNPIANRSVLVYLRMQSTSVEGKLVAGGPSRKFTDDAGHVEFLLPRGVSITLSIAGTDLSRDIDTPTDPAIASFDMLDPTYGRDDLFAVQRPNIPFAARRSL